MCLQMRPVDIQIEDKYKFQRVAFLVDREDFLKDIGSARRDLHLEGPINYAEVLNYLNQLKEDAEKSGQKTNTLDVVQPDGSDDVLFTDARFVKIIKWFKKKYKKTFYYDMVLTYSILSGVVKEKEIIMGTAFVQILNDGILKNLSQEEGQFQVAIVVTPETTAKEVEKIFNTKVKETFKLIKMPKLDTHPNIKQVRDWYWLKKNGNLSWDQLSRTINKKYKIRSETIRSAVRGYIKMLSKKLY